ncbi:hypothetical protein PAUR_a0855 [Pseudoalteromonas aurantia 208]|uniref:Uncharacterized protein n=1 Tax=Pseudoalteromonas aurantia 208 TaxID=1314867 RepID=A0ABR9E933_9GAMM|nr:hypothetical protein [Pseudoalteromonas aurantia 208]
MTALSLRMVITLEHFCQSILISIDSKNHNKLAPSYNP